MKKISRMILILIFITAAFCEVFWAEDKLTVAIAANLSGVMEELKKSFAAEHPDLKIDVIAGSSGKLAAQVLSGAAYDIFMSADMDTPQKLREAGFVEKGPIKYAGGVLIVFTVKNVNVEKWDKAVLLKEIKRISIANPQTSPYSKAALEVLEKKKLFENVKDKLVTAANISDVVTQVISGADIGFTALSLMNTQAASIYNVKGKNWLEVDSSLYAPINQGMVILKHGKDNSAAEKFYNFIISKKAGKVFRKYGYKT